MRGAPPASPPRPSPPPPTAMAPSLGPPRDSTAQLPFRPLLRVQAQVQRLRQTLLGMQGVNYNNRAVQTSRWAVCSASTGESPWKTPKQHRAVFRVRAIVRARTKRHEHDEENDSKNLANRLFYNEQLRKTIIPQRFCRFFVVYFGTFYI